MDSSSHRKLTIDAILSDVYFPSVQLRMTINPLVLRSRRAQCARSPPTARLIYHTPFDFGQIFGF